MANPDAAAPKPEVLARLKIPAFTPDDPEVWFQQVEWALEDVGVTTSMAKFRQVAKSLDAKYSKEVRDLIINPPAERPYEKLKEELLRRLGKSQANKIRQLLDREDIGDRKPSQFLRHLQQLAGDITAEDIIHALWMEQINPLARASIAAQAAQPNVTLEDLGRIADCVMDALGAIPPQQKQVSAVSSSGEQSQLCDVLERLTVRLDEQSRELNELRAEVRGRQRVSGGSDTRRRSRFQSQNQYGGLCLYHHRFGAKAQKCVKPCTHISGKDNVVADALSRVDEIAAPLDFEALAASQQDDPELQELRQRQDSGLLLRQITIPGSSAAIFCDVSTTTARPFLTAAFRRPAFDAIHGLSHPGAKATTKLVTQRYVWPYISKDCRAWSRVCIQCQRSKVTQHVAFRRISVLPHLRRSIFSMARSNTAPGPASGNRRQGVLHPLGRQVWCPAPGDNEPRTPVRVPPVPMPGQTAGHHQHHKRQQRNRVT